LRRWAWFKAIINKIFWQKGSVLCVAFFAAQTQNAAEGVKMRKSEFTKAAKKAILRCTI
jgi:hypothetical protein